MYLAGLASAGRWSTLWHRMSSPRIEPELEFELMTAEENQPLAAFIHTLRPPNARERVQLRSLGVHIPEDPPGQCVFTARATPKQLEALSVLPVVSHLSGSVEMSFREVAGS